MSLVMHSSVSINEQEKRRGVLFMIVAGITWGTSGTLSRFVPECALAMPLMLACLRVFTGGALLCLISLAGRREGGFLLQKEAFLAGLCCCANQAGFFVSMDSLGVALGTMLVIGSSIVMAGIFGLFSGERPSGLWWFAAALGIAGSVLAAVPDSGISGVGAFSLGGFFFGILGGVGYASLGIFLKRLGQKGFSSTESNGAALLYGSLFLIPFAVRGNAGWLLSGQGALSVIALGVFATAVPYYFFAAALSRISIAQSYAISLLEPLTAALLGVFLLNEHIGAVQYAGMALEAACMIISCGDAIRKSAPSSIQ